MIGKWNKKLINNINPMSLTIKLKPKHARELESKVLEKSGST